MSIHLIHFKQKVNKMIVVYNYISYFKIYDMDPILSTVMASLEAKCLPVARGTFLADVIVVCLAARPRLPTQLKRRR